MLRSRGFTLVELMIALTIASIIMAASLSLLVNSTHQAYVLHQQSRLLSELQLLATVIENEVQLSGYDGKAIARTSNSPTALSPFATKLVINAFKSEQPSSCLLFVYDKNHDGVLDTSNPNEQSGYRIRDGALEMRMGNATCSKGLWQDLTDKDLIEITEFRVDIVDEPTRGGNKRALKFSLSAHLQLNPGVKHTIQWVTPLRNSHA